MAILIVTYRRMQQPFSPRCIKDIIEEDMFFEHRNLFSNFDLVFFDTTSLYFEGAGGQTIGKRGNSDEAIRGHVFCSFLALVLRKEFDRRLDKAGHCFEWADVKQDLKALQETIIEDNCGLKRKNVG